MRLTNDDVNSHIKEMTEIFQSLTLLGCTVDDEEKVCLLLSSLPKQYDVLVTAFGAADKAPTFEQVTERLLADVTRSSGARPVHRPEEVMKAWGKRGKTALKCYNCHKEGHFKKNCPLLRQSQNHSKKKHFSNSSKQPSSFLAEQCLSGENTGIKDSKWILDSGATSHMCSDINLFSDFQRTDSVVVTLGDGHKISSVGIGKIHLDLGGEQVILNDVICVPDLAHNMISVTKILKHGGSVTFSNGSGKIINEKRVLAYVKHDDLCNQFVVECVPIRKTKSRDSALNVKEKSKSVVLKDSQDKTREDLWHCRFGHLGTDNLSKLSHKEMVSNFDYDHKKKVGFCEFCTMGKQTRFPFSHSDNQSVNDVLGLIHSDVCGPLPNSLGNNKYFVTFIDHYTRHCWAYPIQSKDKVFSVFKEFKAMIEKETGKQIKTLRSDNGGEYKSNEFMEYTTECGIRHEFTIPKTPEQNGVAERLNRVLIEKVRSMLVQSRLPQRFWAEALNTAVHVHNLSPSRVLSDKTPRELFTGRKPNVSYLKSFGCTAFAHIPKDERKKLDPKSKKCIFMGYG